MTSFQVAELARCKYDIVYFATHYICICNEVSSERIELTKEQIRILRRASKHRKYLLKSCRQFGKTTLGLILALHSLLFGTDESIVYVSNKHASSEHISNILKGFIDYLPHWIAKQFSTKSKFVYAFGGNVLRFVNSNPVGCRGIVPTLLICDELAFFDSEFWQCLYPIVSSGRKTKIAIFSTPKERNDVVESVYSASYEGFNDFVCDLVTWKDAGIWSEDKIRGFKEALSEESFLVEFECQV